MGKSLHTRAMRLRSVEARELLLNPEMFLLLLLHDLKPPKRVLGGTAAFTLTEVIISLAIIGAMSSGCFLGFNAINNYSVTSRLYSEAQAAAQNQIDLILSRAPFDVMVTPKKVPLELMTAAELAAVSPALATAPPSKSNSYYPYYRDASGLLAKEAFIYQDPNTGEVLVRGTLTTNIAEVGDTMTLDGISTALNTRQAIVRVNYVFRNKEYLVAMDTLRTADR